MVEVKRGRQARSPRRLGPAPPPRRLARPQRRPHVRLRRGEDDPEDAAGLRLQGRRRRQLGPQLHDPQPRRLREPPGLHHLGDRLGPGDRPAARRHPTRRVHWLDVAGAPQRLPGLRRRARLRPNGDGKYTFPDEVPTDPSAPGYEERENISHAPPAGRSAGRRTLVFGAGHLHPGGAHVDLQVARDGPDAGTIDGDDPAEVTAAVPDPTPTTTSPPARSAGTCAMTATRPDWRISLKAGDTVSINVTYDVSKASWYESMGILPARLSAGRRPGGEGPVRRRRGGQGDVRRGRHPHPRPPAREHRLEGAQGPEAAGPAQAQAQGPGSRRAASRSTASATRRAGTRPTAASRHELMRPPVIKPGAVGHLHQPRRAARRAPNEQQVWHSITSCRRRATRARGSATRSPTGRSSFDSGQLGYGTGTSSEVTTGIERLHDAAARPSQARPTPTSAGSTRSCAARSGWSPGIRHPDLGGIRA